MASTLVLANCKGQEAEPRPVAGRAEMLQFAPGGFLGSQTRCAPNSVTVRPMEVGSPVMQYLEAFEIDRRVVSCAQLDECRSAEVCHDVPVACADGVAVVRAEAAAAYCAWRGATLPTWAEWQRSARLLDGRRYPAGEPVKDAWCPRNVHGEQPRCATSNTAGFEYAVKNPHFGEWTSDFDCSPIGEAGGNPGRLGVERLVVDLSRDTIDRATTGASTAEFRCARSGSAGRH